MARQKYPPMKDRRDIGKVEFAIEKLIAAREISSSCIGAEALLEADSPSIRVQLKKDRKGSAD